MTRAILAGAAMWVAAAAVAAGQGGAAATVWDGAFTAAQAETGRTLYAAHCASCHGGALEGAEAKALAGEAFWTAWREQSVGDLLAYVAKNMPASEDGSLAGTLSPSTYAAIVAHILRTNNLPAGSRELSATATGSVKIVAKGGTGELPASTLAVVVGCLTPRAANGDWRIVKATPPQRATATTKPDAAAPLGTREFALKFVLRPLTGMVGHRVAVTGALMGEGGVDGINVNTVTSLAPTCD